MIKLKNDLKVLGLTEVMTYSIISNNLLALSQTVKNKVVELANPLTDQWQYMRPTLLISLAQVAAQNQYIKDSQKIFEIARVYLKKQKGLPDQPLILAIALTNSNFYEAKGFVENISGIIGRDLKIYKLKKKHLTQEDLSAAISEGSEQVGYFGLIDSKISDYFELNGPLYVVEINLTEIFNKAQAPKSYKKIHKYPPVIEDISVIVAEALEIGDILELLGKTAKPLLTKADVIDVYRDKKLGENKKSVTVRLYFQKAGGMPTPSDVATTRGQIISALEKTYRAMVRK